MKFWNFLSISNSINNTKKKRGQLCLKSWPLAIAYIMWLLHYLKTLKRSTRLDFSVFTRKKNKPEPWLGWILC